MEIQALKNRFGIVGNAPGLINALSIAERVSNTDLTVMITGESGVGKEVFSQIIHNLSHRKHNQFIAVNCGAIPEGTIDSELFGHEKGAYTGAIDKRKGYFETVDGGTIFLDEIGEMPLSTQARLLRLLQNGEFIKVGSSAVQKTNVRVIAATNVNLQDHIQKGKFREDLYYRLNTVPISVPALRERGEDIYLLFRKFSSDFAEKNNIQNIRLDDEAKVILMRYNWPGNIRQLKNVAEQITILSPEREIDAVILSSFLPIAQDKLMKYNSPNMDMGDHSDRDLLYRFLLDIKQDINDIKKFLATGHHDLGQKDFNTPNYNAGVTPLPSKISEYNDQFSNQTPMILNTQNQMDKSDIEIVDDDLSLMKVEKEYIIKALKKYKGKRKSAAIELGISERTLYRKIEDYNIIE
jgi:DNA-binding NtrC family response regulator